MQPDAFGSIPQAMWWAMAALTTVGYGDAIPMTTVGKLLGSIVTILGIGMEMPAANLLEWPILHNFLFWRICLMMIIFYQ